MWASAFSSKQRPSLEAQLANLADEIAYNNHDVDDGLRSGLLAPRATCSRLPSSARQLEAVREHFPGLAERRLIYETVRRMVNALVTDLIRQSQANIDQSQPTVASKRCAPARR